VDLGARILLWWFLSAGTPLQGSRCSGRISRPPLGGVFSFDRRRGGAVCSSPGRAGGLRFRGAPAAGAEVSTTWWMGGGGEGRPAGGLT